MKIQYILLIIIRSKVQFTRIILTCTNHLFLCTNLHKLHVCEKLNQYKYTWHIQDIKYILFWINYLIRMYLSCHA